MQSHAPVVFGSVKEKDFNLLINIEEKKINTVQRESYLDIDLQNKKRLRTTNNFRSRKLEIKLVK